MNRRDFLRAIAAVPVVAVLAPLIPAPARRFFQSPDIDMALPEVVRVPRYVRARMTWEKANYRQSSVATLGGFSRDDTVTFWIEGDNPSVELEGSADGVSWAPHPNAVPYRIERY